MNHLTLSPALGWPVGLAAGLRSRADRAAYPQTGSKRRNRLGLRKTFPCLHARVRYGIDSKHRLIHE